MSKDLAQSELNSTTEVSSLQSAKSQSPRTKGKVTHSRAKAATTPNARPEAPLSTLPTNSQSSTSEAEHANAMPPRNTKHATTPITKTETVIKKLRSAKGMTLDQLIEATGWQAHSVRGFLSGTVKKKLGLILANEIGKDGRLRYRITSGAAG